MKGYKIVTTKNTRIKKFVTFLSFYWDDLVKMMRKKFIRENNTYELLWMGRKIVFYLWKKNQGKWKKSIFTIMGP